MNVFIDPRQKGGLWRFAHGIGLAVVQESRIARNCAAAVAYLGILVTGVQNNFPAFACWVGIFLLTVFCLGGALECLGRFLLGRYYGIRGAYRREDVVRALNHVEWRSVLEIRRAMIDAKLYESDPEHVRDLFCPEHAWLQSMLHGLILDKHVVASRYDAETWRYLLTKEGSELRQTIVDADRRKELAPEYLLPR